MDNKEGKRKMKWQLSNRGERELEWAADGNAVLGGRGGSWWGWRRERRAGPVREWHRCNSLMPQRAFCRGTSQGWDLSSASGWVTGVLQSVEELGWNPPLPGNHCQNSAWLSLISQCNGDFTLWESGSQKCRKVWEGSIFSVVSCGYLTCRRPMRGRTRGWSEGTASGTATWSTGHRSCILLLPGDACATSRPPQTAEVQGHLQELIWKLEINRAPQCFLWVWWNSHPSYTPWSSAGFPRGEEAAGQHRGQSGSGLGTATSLQGHSHDRDLLPVLQPVSLEPSGKAKCLVIKNMSRDAFLYHFQSGVTLLVIRNFKLIFFHIVTALPCLALQLSFGSFWEGRVLLEQGGAWWPCRGARGHTSASPGPACCWQGTCEAGLHQTFGRTNPYPQVPYSQQFSNGSFCPPKPSWQCCTARLRPTEIGFWPFSMPHGNHKPRLCFLGCLQTHWMVPALPSAPAMGC